jgi:hypothetical protein
MPNYSQSTRNRVADAIFNIIGGRVAMTAILGEVTTVLGAVGNISIESNPTVGTTAALCAVLAAGALEEGTLLSIDGTLATAMLGVYRRHAGDRNAGRRRRRHGDAEQAGRAERRHARLAAVRIEHRQHQVVDLVRAAGRWRVRNSGIGGLKWQLSKFQSTTRWWFVTTF